MAAGASCAMFVSVSSSMSSWYVSIRSWITAALLAAYLTLRSPHLVTAGPGFRSTPESISRRGRVGKRRERRWIGGRTASDPTANSAGATVQLIMQPGPMV